MSHHEMGHHPDENSDGKSAKGATGDSAGRTGQKDQNTWPPETPDEASTGGQKATQRPEPGEKFHGDKLQSPAGGQGSKDAGRNQH